jgi:dihydrofolate synthase / folylpolyglutamate synthase
MIEKLLADLFSRQRLGIKPGLERTRDLLLNIGNPHGNFPSVHIAGTNGKGAVCSVISSVLQEAGYRVGLYTSPHLVNFNERIRINGKMISDDEILSIWDKLKSPSDDLEATFYEITTAMAFEYFSEQNVDIAIIETGLGGRLDSTNVLTPICCGITSIALDHAEFLGDTIESVAREKAGIIKNNIPCFIGNIPEDAKSIFNQNDIKYITKQDNHRESNRELSRQILLNIRGKFNWSENDFKSGIGNISKNTGYFGRIELIRESPKLILDTGHNPESFSALVNQIQTDYPNQKFDIVFTAMKDKNYSESMRILSSICNQLILIKTKQERNASLNDMAYVARELNINNKKITSFDKIINSENDTIVCGSFFLIGEFLEYQQKNNNFNC